MVLLGALGVGVGAAAWAWSASGPAATVAHVVATLAIAIFVLVVVALEVAQASLPFPYPRLALQLLETTVSGLGAMVATRALSVLALTTKVFMVRVRDLGYRLAHAELPGRVVALHIYAADGALDRLDPSAPSPAVRAARARERHGYVVVDDTRGAPRRGGHGIRHDAGLARAVSPPLAREGRRAPRRSRVPRGSLRAAERAWERANAVD